MAFCKQKKEDIMLEVTPIENYFIQEYLRTAPGDFVKVYIYGLMQSLFPECAEENMERFASSLMMSEQEVLDALNYWQRCGLVQVNDDCCVFLNVKGAMLYGAASLSEKYMYRYAELNAQISALFGSRKLKQSEWTLIYDWVEVMGLSEEAAVMLIKYCIINHGKRVGIQTMNATARDWAQKGIKTPEQVAQYVNTFHLTISEANRVAAHFGFRRRVTQEEYELYEKWTKQFGFDIEAVLAACGKTVASSNPNFAYLNKIIETFNARGINTAAAIKKSIEDEKNLREKVLQCAQILGSKVTTGAEDFYRQWSNNYKLDHEAIIQIIIEAGRNGISTFKDADALVGSYVRSNKMTKSDIKDEQASRKSMDQKLNRVKADLGLKTLTSSEKRALEKWLDKMNIELISQGAEYTSGAQNPVAYLCKILESWEAAGIKTAGQAREQREKFRAEKNNAGTDEYSQKINSLYTDL